LKLIGVKSARMTIVGLGLVFLLALAPRAFALSNGQAANLVLGQANFISNNTVATTTELDVPNGLAFDSGGNLWVVDQNNNRVLEYKAPFSTHEAATLVIGQSSFTSSGTATTSTGLSGPSGLAFDSGGNLWVVDTGNSRVLEYKTPFSIGEAATLVIGQSSFTSSDFSTTNSTGLSYATGIAFDSGGNLWVADQGNNRVLEYKAPLSTNEAASLVIGQTSFTASNTGATGPSNLNGVKALTFDSGGNLWVVDFRQSRVLEYTTPFTNHEAASLVIGQPSFTSRTCAFTSTCAPSPTVLFDPNALAFDSGGNLWVADGDNNRVLEYTAPLSTHEAATVVIGQANFTGGAATTTSTGLSAPEGLAFDSGHNLWVADAANSRVLQYGGASVTTASATTSSTTTTSTTPEFPALALPIVFTIVMAAAALLLKPSRRFRRL
jgi:sugar lactone lactonase YvrE